MRYSMLALLFCGYLQAASLDGIPVTVGQEGLADVFMEDSLFCNDPSLLLETKEITLANFTTGDTSEVQEQIRVGKCDVTSVTHDVLITRVVRGFIRGLDGKLTAEILLEVRKEDGTYFGWTESVNLELTAQLYEGVKARMNKDLQ